MLVSRPRRAAGEIVEVSLIEVTYAGIGGASLQRMC